MILKPTEIDELLSVIDKYMMTFAAHHVGIGGLSQSQIAQLTAAGVNVSSIGIGTSNIAQAYKFGILSTALGDRAAKNMSFDQLKTHISSGKVFKLSPLEEAALKNLQYQTVNQVQSFGNKVKDSIKEKLVYADKKLNSVKHSAVVTQAAKKAIEERKGVTQVISDIVHSVDNWDKDFGRISDFVLHTAFDEGRAAGVVRQGGIKGLVYKDVYPGACKHCMYHYLTGGIGSAPKIFTVAELQANGTNIGRKVKQWLPVIGPLHPWCRCTLMLLPNGFTLHDYKDGVWVWNGQDFIMDSSKRKRKVNRKSKVNVTVNGKTTVI